MRNNKHLEDHENHERWLVSYADFITLLFAFFVVLYATSTQNEEKEKQFEQSIRAELKIAALIQGGMKALSKSLNEGKLDPLDVFSRRARDNEELLEGIEKWLESHLTDFEKKNVYSGILYDEIGVRISFFASALFLNHTMEFNKEAVGALEKVAQMIKKTSYRIVVEGHAESGKNSWEISSLRSAKIVKFFIENQKLEASRFSSVSFADQKPLVDGENAISTKLNDRMDILIINQ